MSSPFCPQSVGADTEAMLIKIDLHSTGFEPLVVLEHWQQAQSGIAASAAEAHFIGRVRGVAADGCALEALELEHYPGMTEQQLEQLARDCCSRHRVNRCLVQHRIGRVLPGEAIVLVAIGADRRGPAQRCCQELLEALKHHAPFWKREWRSDGSREWLSGNTPL